MCTEIATVVTCCLLVEIIYKTLDQLNLVHREHICNTLRYQKQLLFTFLVYNI